MKACWAILSSVWVGLFLLLNLAGLATFITLRYPEPEPYFLHPLYLGLLAAFGVNILCVLTDRYRFRTEQAGFLLTHMGIVTVLAGGALTHWCGEDGQMRIPEGGATDRFTVERAGEGGRVRLTPVPKTVVSHVLTAQVGRVTPDFPAEAAGLRRGDRIVAINGQPVETWPDLAQVIHASPGRPVILTLLRGEERLEVTVTPRRSRPPDNPEGREIGLIGIEPINDVIRKESQVWDLGIGPAFERLHPLAALAEGVRRTVDVSVTVLWFLGKLLQGALPAKTIGGPLTIVLMAGEQAQQGFLYLVTFTAVISINLAILNLLPIPILDGGHLLFAAIEAVRGEPVSVRRREMAQKVGLALLVAIMAFAVWNDIIRVLAP